jgi:superfamily II DNA helicase RecQ
MEYHFFAVPALDPQNAQDALNRLCAQRRVVSVDRQFVAAGIDSFWAVCVTVAPGPGPLPDALKTPERRSGSRNGGAGSSRIDYKQVLDEADFALFAELRAWRKQTAEGEGVPIYAVFTNEQLADIVRRRVDTLAALGEIDGIGPARLQRYGPEVLARVQAARLPPVPEERR